MNINKDLSQKDKREIQRLLDSLDSELVELGQLLYLIDKVWDEMECDNIIVDGEKLAAFYSHPVWILNGMFAEKDPLSLQHRHAISNWITTNKLNKVVDFGGGFGTLARMISNKSNRQTQIEIYEPYPSDFSISCCKEYPSISFVSELANDYDCLVSTDVLEHVTEPLKLLDKMIGSVKVGGYLIIANCFYPIIKCHLPLTFHLRYTFDKFAIAMGLDVIGNCTGSHATIYKKLSNHQVDWEKIKRMSLVSKRLFLIGTKRRN